MRRPFDIPENATELEKFVSGFIFSSMCPTIVKDSDTEESYILIHDNSGYMLEREKLKLIADEIYKTLELDDIDDFIESNNARQYFKGFCGKSEFDKNKFAVPFQHLKTENRKFNKNKRATSFKCGNCSKKISSKDTDDYIHIRSRQEYLWNTDYFERACSNGCAKVIIKDIIQNWTTDFLKDRSKYFYLENLSQQVDEHIRLNLEAKK